MLKLIRQGKRAPRIAIVRYNDYPADMHVRRDALALRDAGFEVDLICAREPGKPFVERAEGITVVRIPPGRRRGGLGRYLLSYTAFPLLASAIVALGSLRRAYRYVEINNLPDWLILAGLLPKLLGAKVTLYCREDMPRLLASDLGLSPSHPAVRLLRAIQRTCGRLADCIITTQELARSDLIEHGTPADKIVVVPNAPDERLFCARIPNVLPSGAVGPDGDRPFRLVTHGTLIKRYGLETLLEAMAILRDRTPAAHLDIIGDGEHRPELETLTDHLGLRACVTFTGWLPDYEEVAPRLVQADVGVVTLWTDFQLCNKLVDYLALGIPTITSRSAALQPYLDDGEVYYVEPKNAQALADAIMTLYLDPDRRSALAKAGHAAYLEHFAWERAKHDYLAIYASERNRDSGRDSRERVHPQMAVASSDGSTH